MTTIMLPSWAVRLLISQTEEMLAQKADALGKAGHTPSEELAEEYAALAVAKAEFPDLRT